MFTGIVQGMGQVCKREEKNKFITFGIQFPSILLKNLECSASVSIAGVCLTVTEIDGLVVFFDAMSETLHRTTLKEYGIGCDINIERSVKMADEVGGHILSGHVACVATISHIEEEENNIKMTFQVDSELMKFIFSKGFIGLDGCSLTVTEPMKDTFSVWFIPETLRRTTFGNKRIGDHVNVEIDSQTQAIVQTVERYFNAQKYVQK